MNENKNAVYKYSHWSKDPCQCLRTGYCTNLKRYFDEEFDAIYYEFTDVHSQKTHKLIETFAYIGDEVSPENIKTVVGEDVEDLPLLEQLVYHYENSILWGFRSARAEDRYNFERDLKRWLEFPQKAWNYFCGPETPTTQQIEEKIKRLKEDFEKSDMEYSAIITEYEKKLAEFKERLAHI